MEGADAGNNEDALELEALVIRLQEVLNSHGKTNMNSLVQQMAQALVQRTIRRRSGRRAYDTLRDVLIRNHWKAR